MSGQVLYQTHNDCLNQMHNSIAVLEYWKAKTTDERAWLIGIAIQMLEHVAKDIYDNELKGIARLEE
jgi:hypothetical protein